MVFLYYLMDGNDVFYVGKTKDLSARYLQHLSKGSELVIARIVSILERGEIPLMRFVRVMQSNDDEASEIQGVSHGLTNSYLLTDKLGASYQSRMSHSEYIRIRDRHRVLRKVYKDKIRSHANDLKAIFN